MKYLVFCACDHALDRHVAEGCEGDGRRPCACRNDQDRALESAVDHARTNPWGAPRAEALQPDVA